MKGLRVDRTRSLLTTLAELAGLGAISAGSWLISVIVGLIVTGLCLVAVGVLGA